MRSGSAHSQMVEDGRDFNGIVLLPGIERRKSPILVKCRYVE
jgi:hypothetical protein